MAAAPALAPTHRAPYKAAMDNVPLTAEEVFYNNYKFEELPSDAEIMRFLSFWATKSPENKFVMEKMQAASPAQLAMLAVNQTEAVRAGAASLAGWDGQIYQLQVQAHHAMDALAQYARDEMPAHIHPTDPEFVRVRQRLAVQEAKRGNGEAAMASRKVRLMRAAAKWKKAQMEANIKRDEERKMLLKMNAMKMLVDADEGRAEAEDQRRRIIEYQEQIAFQATQKLKFQKAQYALERASAPPLGLASIAAMIAPAEAKEVKAPSISMSEFLAHVPVKAPAAPPVIIDSDDDEELGAEGGLADGRDAARIAAGNARDAARRFARLAI